MKLAIFVSAAATQAGRVEAVPLIKPSEEKMDATSGMSTLAQTDAQFIGRIFDIMEMFINHLFPLDPDQRMKSHGTHFNVVDNNNTAAEHGGKMGGNHDSSKAGSAGKAEGNFGGSFWSQIDSEDGAAFESFLPRVPEMSDGALLAELAELTSMSQDELLSEIESKGHNEEQLLEAMRVMAELDTETIEAIVS